MTEALGNSTLSAARNWSYWCMLASYTVMDWKDTSKCSGQVIIKRQCKVAIVQVQMIAYNPMKIGNQEVKPLYFSIVNMSQFTVLKFRWLTLYCCGSTVPTVFVTIINTPPVIDAVV